MLEKFETIRICDKEFDVYGTIEEPWFKAVDVARIIDYSMGNTFRMVDEVDNCEKGQRICMTPGGRQKIWMLTEHGVYEVLMRSTKPIAKQFKRGVKQILREIRMGTYQPPFTEPQPMRMIFEHCRTFGDLMYVYEERCAVDDGYEFVEDLS